MKLLIAGGRDYNEPDFSEKIMGVCSMYGNPTEIVSGACPNGADRMGELWAKEYSVPIKLFPADWDTHGNAAGPIRNRQMALYCDRAIIFWDGKSAGTKNMITQLQKANKPYTIIYY